MLMWQLTLQAPGTALAALASLFPVLRLIPEEPSQSTEGPFQLKRTSALTRMALACPMAEAQGHHCCYVLHRPN